MRVASPFKSHVLNRKLVYVSSSSRMTHTTSTNMTVRTKICVYCGASPGASPAHIEAARNIARAMAAKNIDLGQFSSILLVRHAFDNV